MTITIGAKLEAMKGKVFERLIQFLNDLDASAFSYTLAHHRDEAIMVLIAVPGERWEVEFLSDGSVDVERFISDGEIQGQDALGELFAKYADPQHEVLAEAG